MSNDVAVKRSNIKCYRRCKTTVGTPPHYLSWHQCTRAAGHGPEGLYCKQHAKIAEKDAKGD